MFVSSQRSTNFSQVLKVITYIIFFCRSQFNHLLAVFDTETSNFSSLAPPALSVSIHNCSCHGLALYVSRYYLKPPVTLATSILCFQERT